MPYLLDTNILGRLLNPADSQHALANNARRILIAQGESLHITAQNLIELRAIMTRPVTANGFGWSVTQAEIEAAQLEATFGFLPDNAVIFTYWKTLMRLTGTAGKQAHDGRLAATALAYGIPNILTFNGGDFQRYIPHGVVPIDPAAL